MTHSTRFPTAATVTLLAFWAAAAPYRPTWGQTLAPTPPAFPKSAPLAVVSAPPSAAAPLGLTASDGSGLELLSLSAQAVVEDPLAFTELHLVFRNPENRVREGRFRITLPPGATISRFAMRVGPHWQEGEVVEQQAARVAYEDFLHRRQDPALLEAEAGNEFSARVFPIPANATKELIVSYSQELPRAREPYRLPLRGLPRLGSLSIRALVDRAQADAAGAGRRSRHEVVEVHKRDFKPDSDFEVTTGQGAVAGGARAGLRHENLVVTRIVPVADTQRPSPLTSLFVLIDTSASRALGLDEQITAFERLIAELRRTGDPRISVAAFDQDVTSIFSGTCSAMGDAVRKALNERRALGASDMDRALAWLAAAKKEPGARALLITDGVVTAGDATADKLRARVKALGPAGIDRLDVFAVGGIRDDALLARLVTAGLAKDGVVLDGTQAAAVSARRLLYATRSGIKVAIDGAGWVWPSTLNGIQPGDEVLVYADLPRDRSFRLTVDGVPLKTAGALMPVERPLLERSWVRARIARLIEQRDDVAAADRDLADALRKQVIELSVRHRVLSPFTSLLVLETEQDYARFGIERRALADILTVGKGGTNGIAVVRRTEIASGTAVALQPAPADAPLASHVEPVSEGVRRDDLAKRAPFDEEAKSQNRGARPGLGGIAASGAGRPAAVAVPRAVVEAGPATASEKAVHDDRSAGSATVAATPATPAPAPSRAARPPAPAARTRASRVVAAERVSGDIAVPRVDAFAAGSGPAVDGQLAQVLATLHRGRGREALAGALAWRQRDPGDVLALVALGECWEALGNVTQAARAYGSIIDLFPGRADMRRFAGERLERIRGAAALALAVDTYRKAVAQRPDHPAGHRLLGFALLKQGHAHAGFDAIAAGLMQTYPADRFRGVMRVLREDLGLAAAVWTRAEPARAGDIRQRLVRAGGTIETAASLRFVLNWETDANDVDFHIEDARGGHAYYASPRLASGGELYADVTTGYGPECFTIRGPTADRAFPYRLRAHYYSRGPMGYGMGKLQVIDHDGQGRLRFEERPFVIMQDGAFVNLGTVNAAARPLAATVKASEAAEMVERIR
ncbi:MAG: VIT domain-containing protein [Bacteroidota bacterium]